MDTRKEVTAAHGLHRTLQELRCEQSLLTEAPQQQPKPNKQRKAKIVSKRELYSNSYIKVGSRVYKHNYELVFDGVSKFYVEQRLRLDNGVIKTASIGDESKKVLNPYTAVILCRDVEKCLEDCFENDLIRQGILTAILLDEADLASNISGYSAADIQDTKFRAGFALERRKIAPLKKYLSHEKRKLKGGGTF